MTNIRLLAICIICFCFWNLLPGQELQAPDNSAWPPDHQAFVADSISPDSTGGDLLIPNVFSPNGDAYNQYFEVTTDGVTVYEFSIFTRSGACIFRSCSPRIFWDGRDNSGMEQGEGIYYYVIAEQDASDPYTKSGFLYLYR